MKTNEEAMAAPVEKYVTVYDMGSSLTLSWNGDGRCRLTAGHRSVKRDVDEEDRDREVVLMMKLPEDGRKLLSLIQEVTRDSHLNVNDTVIREIAMSGGGGFFHVTRKGYVAYISCIGENKRPGGMMAGIDLIDLNGVITPRIPVLDPILDAIRAMVSASPS